MVFPKICFKPENRFTFMDNFCYVEMISLTIRLEDTYDF